jgi:hypothetical protein
MAVYLARNCPMCRNYFGVVIARRNGRGYGCGKTRKTFRPLLAMALAMTCDPLCHIEIA